MGYYTSIICMGARPKDRPMNSEDWNTETDIISEVDSHSDINNLSDENDPLKEVSLAHKDWIIEVEGRGGDQEDLWRRRYLNGKYETIAPVWPEYKEILSKEEALKDEFQSNIDLTDINSSMELESGQEIARLRRGDRVVTVEVRGEVRVVYKKQTYKSVSQMPEELIQMFRNGKAFNSKKVFVDMNNWFEVFTWTLQDGKLVWTGNSDVVDVENNTPEQMRAFLTDIMNDYFD